MSGKAKMPKREAETRIIETVRSETRWMGVDADALAHAALALEGVYKRLARGFEEWGGEASAFVSVLFQASREGVPVGELGGRWTEWKARQVNRWRAWFAEHVAPAQALAQENPALPPCVTRAEWFARKWLVCRRIAWLVGSVPRPEPGKLRPETWRRLRDMEAKAKILAAECRAMRESAAALEEAYFQRLAERRALALAVAHKADAEAREAKANKKAAKLAETALEWARKAKQKDEEGEAARLEAEVAKARAEALAEERGRLLAEFGPRLDANTTATVATKDAAMDAALQAAKTREALEEKKREEIYYPHLWDTLQEVKTAEDKGECYTVAHLAEILEKARAEGRRLGMIDERKLRRIRNAWEEKGWKNAQELEMGWKALKRKEKE